MSDSTKENRLRLLAKRAGDLSMAAYLGGNRDEAIRLNERMKRILKHVQKLGNTNPDQESNDVGVLPRVDAPKHRHMAFQGLQVEARVRGLQW